MKLNWKNEENWRSGQQLGDCTNIERKNCLGEVYNRHSFTDVMLRSLTKRNWGPSSGRSERQYQNFAVRFPWQGKSTKDQVTSCTRRTDGMLIKPNGLVSLSDYGSKQDAFTYGVNWESNSAGEHNIPSTTNFRFGFFLFDWGGGNRKTAGCSMTQGHFSHVFGAAYVGDWTYYVVTSYGIGGGYGEANSDRGAYALSGHWWGHGPGNMQSKASGLFVRDKNDLE